MLKLFITGCRMHHWWISSSKLSSVNTFAPYAVNLHFLPPFSILSNIYHHTLQFPKWIRFPCKMGKQMIILVDIYITRVPLVSMHSIGKFHSLWCSKPTWCWYHFSDTDVCRCSFGCVCIYQSISKRKEIVSMQQTHSTKCSFKPNIQYTKIA